MSAIIKQLLKLESSYTRYVAIRYMSRRVSVKIDSKLEAARISLESKGFLRSVRAYIPPADVLSRVRVVCERVGVSPEPETCLQDAGAEQRFSLMQQCHQEFKHGVPNSILHTMQTVGDLIEFYSTTVDTTTPLDALKTMELPPNLHVQHDYHRFHPESDTVFGGISAFPKSSTLVTGLKYKKKYPGHNARPWQ